MSDCRGQWAEGRDFGICIACGGELLDHSVYMAWDAKTTYSERQAAHFIPPIADPIPPLVFTDETTFTVTDDRMSICLGCKQLRICDNGLLTLCDDCYNAWPGEDTDPQPIPATAQAILDIGKPTRSAGIARAVSGLQQRDWLLGAARWVP